MNRPSESRAMVHCQMDRHPQQRSEKLIKEGQTLISAEGSGQLDVRAGRSLLRESAAFSHPEAAFSLGLHRKLCILKRAKSSTET
jgi:hypothetical protein